MAYASARTHPARMAQARKSGARERALADAVNPVGWRRILCPMRATRPAAGAHESAARPPEGWEGSVRLHTLPYGSKGRGFKVSGLRSFKVKPSSDSQL